MISDSARLIGLLSFALCLQLSCLCLADDVVHNGDFAKATQGWYVNNRCGPKPTTVDVKDLKGTTKAIKFELKGTNPKKAWLVSLTQGIIGYVPKGTKIKLSFKAKGTTDKTLEAMVQLNGKPYTNIVNSGKISLTDKWETYTYQGTAKKDFPPGGVRIYFRMGYNDGNVLITDISVDMPDGGMPPLGQPLNFNSDFSCDRSGWSIPGNKSKCEYTFYDLLTHRVLKMDIKQGNPKKPWAVSIVQSIACSMPKETHVKLLVRARSPTPDAVLYIYLEGKGKYKERLIKLPNQKLGEDWQWFTAEATMPKDYKPREVRIMMQLAAKEQIIEFDKVELAHMLKVK